MNLNKLFQLKLLKKERIKIKEYSSSKEEEILLRIILSYPEKIDYVLERIKIEDFENLLIKKHFF